MQTELLLDGTRFMLNGRPTYEGREWQGHSIEGLLMNSRMVQAIFDDPNPQTRHNWAYPDTGQWDAERNVNEFCEALPTYREHGLLAVTVGLQGGGAIYSRQVYDQFENSAFAPDGSFREDYFNRLGRVLQTADDCGMVVIVNYFYWKHVRRLRDEATVTDAALRTTEWLLRSGHRNVMVDLVNECNDRYPHQILRPDRVHALIRACQGVSHQGRRLLIGCSSGGGGAMARGQWLAAEHVSLPHGNGLTPQQVAEKVRTMRGLPNYQARPRPICINEDSVFVENLEAAVREGASWGFYCQGYGSDYQDRMNWKEHGREERYQDLSGYQTPPVNWGINTPIKRRFFERLREITGGA